MKSPKNISTFFPSKCCQGVVTTAGFCEKCGLSVHEKRLPPPKPDNSAYDEMWRKAFEVWDAAVEDVYGTKNKT